MDDFVLNGFVQEKSIGFSSSDYFVDRNYRYGFNGMLKDNDIAGAGNHLDYGARGRDPRLGSVWWSIDPLAAKYPDLSPYNFVANSPIIFADPNGKEIIVKIYNN